MLLKGYLSVKIVVYLEERMYNQKIENMKKLMIVAGLLFTGTLFAQDIEAKYTKNGDLIKGTYFFDNGEVKQEGTYKNGELHGKWTAYNQEGKKIAVANYTNGEKTGKWFFWTEDKLAEVDYSDNRIVKVTQWENSGLLAKK